ncbi:MAG: methyl-accepting chemotaxis protein [Planctomycetaceae bacterium]|nr:methyl-accepting chemotaxis protein [Planctomycetaceae bacterium]
MKLFPKILGIGIVGILIAAIISAISIYCGEVLSNIQSESGKYQAFQTELTLAKVSHLRWLQTIENAIISAAPELSIITDGRQCMFGKWYYASGKETLEELPKEFKEIFPDLEKNHLKIHEMGGDLIKMWDKDNLGPAVKFFHDEILPMTNTILSDLERMEECCRTEIKGINEHGAWLLKYQMAPTLVTLLIGILILVSYSWFTAQGIVKPLQQGEHILHGIARDGNIQTDVPKALMSRQDEVGNLGRGVEQILNDYRNVAKLTEKLAAGDWQLSVQEKSSDDVMNQNFSRMLDQVNHTLRKINDDVRQVAAYSSDVSNAAQHLSSGAQEAAASLEEITASMSEISSQTKANAESAGQARDLARRANKAAADGQGAMLEMTNAMERITKNSTEIQRVIKVIDDIAFQTNLLALNAAVEAARAGQHGKGFAVVAEEVRNLASRSAKAAQETSELIAKSGQEIETGADIANRTASVLDAIVEQISQTTDLVSGIATASNEQAEGVAQVTIGLQQIDAVTQQNTASAEESASAAAEMSATATDLQSLVSQFKLR